MMMKLADYIPVRRPFIAAAALACAVVAGPYGPAAESAVSEVSPADIAAWNARLRSAGASPSEVELFNRVVRDEPASERRQSAVFLRRAPPGFFSDFISNARRAEKVGAPRPIYIESDPVSSPEDLRKISIPNTTIESVSVDPSRGSCRVTAIVTHPPAADRITVWVDLPTSGWNGRFHGTGGGGYSSGFLRCLDFPLAQGYAVAATDGGNPRGTAQFALGRDMRNDWPAIRNNAYLATHDMTVVGKAVAQAFYGKVPRYAYFVGYSSGGRQALMEAQRYPEDYDGIVALFPAIYRERYVPAQLWPQIAMREAGDYLSKGKLAAVTAAVVDACDSADGVIDGVIDDPIHTPFDPAVLVGRQVGGSTFTAADAEVVRKIWEGPRGSDGRFLWYGPTPGTDLSAITAIKCSPPEGDPYGEVLDWFRYYLAQGPGWNWRTLSRGGFERLFNRSVEEFGPVIGAYNPDLSAFRDRGGKLVIIHGLADALVPPQGSIRYYDEVVKAMGGLERTRAFARLFLVPGADHGLANAVPVPGANEFYGAAIRWVEDGLPPGRLIAERRDGSGKVVRSRPIFPYPKTATYTGEGSPDDAANFAGRGP